MVRLWDISQDKKLFNALKYCEISKITEILDKVEQKEKNKLLNGTFKLDSTVHTSLSKTLQITKPWTLAVIYSSNEIVEYLFNQGICILEQDFNKNNCIHLMCYAAHLNAAPEQFFQDRFHFLRQLLSQNDLETLLMQENRIGLRPLELAGHLGTMALFLDIFETPGIYLCETNNGIFVEQLFDITEYEAIPEGTRRNKSPMVFLQCVDQRTIRNPSMAKVTNTDYIQQWSWLKLKSNSVVLTCVVFLMFLYFLSFLYLDSHFRYEDESRFISEGHTVNFTCLEQYFKHRSYSPTTIYFMMIFLTSFSVISIIMEICNIIRITLLPGLQSLPNGRKNVSLYYWFQTLSKLALYVNVFGFVVAKIIRMYVTVHFTHYWDDALFAACLIWFSWYFVSTAQIIPKLGVYVILLERMVMSLISFLSICVLFLVMFTSVAFRFFNRRREKCLLEFSTEYKSYYSIFLTIFNMMDYSEIDEKISGQVSGFVIFAFQNLVVGVMALFLLNFLIALFTRSMEEIGRKEEWIVLAQCSFVCSNMENSFSFFFGWLYRRMQRRIFTYRKGKLYLRRTLLCKKIFFGNNSSWR